MQCSLDEHFWARPAALYIARDKSSHATAAPSQKQRPPQRCPMMWMKHIQNSPAGPWRAKGDQQKDKCSPRFPRRIHSEFLGQIRADVERAAYIYTWFLSLQSRLLNSAKRRLSCLKPFCPSLTSIKGRVAKRRWCGSREALKCSCKVRLA